VNQNPNTPRFTGENSQIDEQGESLIKTLRRFRQPGTAQEHCEFCRAILFPIHRHLLEVSNSRIVCTCDPCALRFQDVVGGRFKLIPRDIWSLPQFDLSDVEWEDLALPINLAFFFYSTPEKKMKALYPSPGGATESLLPLTAWNALAEKNPQLTTMRSDVEALLVNRVGANRAYYVVPIDICFELVGTIRMYWRGLSGGDAVWQKVEALFDRLSVAARPVPAPS